MMELTKERLQEIESVLSAGALGYSVERDEVLAMARQLLAGMEQEPVGITDRSEIEGLKRGEMANVMPADFKGVDAGDEVLLYAAPQLPQPAGLSVPEGVLKSLLPDAEKSEFWFEHDGKIFFEGVKFNNAVFEACRSAMLQGAEPVQGWIPCSERMPVENDIVLVVDDGYFVCEAQYREGDFFSAARGKGEFFETTCRDVELWMPLPAAPQQEV